MKKHTPGPWHWVNPDNDSVWDGKTDTASLRTIKEYGKNETKVINGDSYTSFALPKFVLDYVEGIENIADARLIAAAPDLMAAAELLLQQYDSSGDFTMGGNLTNEPFLLFRAALARAKDGA